MNTVIAGTEILANVTRGGLRGKRTVTVVGESFVKVGGVDGPVEYAVVQSETGRYGIASQLLTPGSESFAGWTVAGDLQSTLEEITACFTVLTKPVKAPRVRIAGKR